MKTTILGVGAIGGHLAARLGSAGADVSVVARGATLDAIRRNGVVLRVSDKDIAAKITATDDARDLGKVDVVFVSVKAIDPKSLAHALAPLVGPTTSVVFAQNGIPWWYGIGLRANRPKPPDLTLLDPGHQLASLLKPEQIVGGVIHSSNEMREPGIVINESIGANTLHLGFADDRSSRRIDDLRSMLVAAGLQSPPNADIRHAIWRKLVINMTASIICLITGHRATVIRDDPGIAALYGALAREALAIAAAHGIELSAADAETFRQKAPDHLPSIRQDYDRRKPLEIDALVKAPLAFARAADLQVPHFETIAALACRLAQDVDSRAASSTRTTNGA